MDTKESEKSLPLPSFLCQPAQQGVQQGFDLSTADTLGWITNSFPRGLSYTLQNVQQRPWSLPTRLQVQPHAQICGNQNNLRTRTLTLSIAPNQEPLVLPSRAKTWAPDGLGS